MRGSRLRFATRIGLGSVLASMLLAGALEGSAVAATPNGPTKWGYIRVADGAQLRYNVYLPGPGRHPVALEYDPYGTGVDAIGSGSDPDLATLLYDHGFAVVGLSLPGIACSSGVFNPLSPQWEVDGAAAIEWLLKQRWSDGHLGMFGHSFPALAQIPIAGMRPRGLDAIAPLSPLVDAYRDVMYPGGIANIGFPVLWGTLVNAANSGAAARAAQMGDAQCAINEARASVQSAPAAPGNTIATTDFANPFDDGLWSALDKDGADADTINIPVLGCRAWQDDAIGSRIGDTFYNHLDPALVWTVDTSGDHYTCKDAPILQLVLRFLERFVADEHNGFTATPHVQIWHETTATGPSWVTTYPRWPVPVTPIRLNLHANGSMSLAPGRAGSDAYHYPRPSSSMADSFEAQNNAAWAVPDASGGWVAYTSPRLKQNVEFYGSASADLVFSSTAPDTDLQVTITDVMPDGQELYVQRGWLRASMRKLNAALSTPLAPVQTDRQADQEMLRPGKPTLLRVYVDPFDFVFRKGSAIRLWIDAPTGTTGLWAFRYLTTPAVNTIYTGPKMDSQLVLGLAPRPPATPKPEAACDTIINQPCRPNQLPVPAGSLTIPPMAHKHRGPHARSR